jgi:hypothetical protein
VYGAYSKETLTRALRTAANKLEGIQSVVTSWQFSEEIMEPVTGPYHPEVAEIGPHQRPVCLTSI